LHTVGIIQARMGSTRFPGKMLANLGGIPCFEWVVTRLRRAKTLDSVLLATTNLSSDDNLVNLARDLGVEVYRGDEHDVLGRFIEASHISKAERVVRICADNPFIEPEEVDRLVTFFDEVQCDYACNHQNRLGSSYADGFGAEITTAKILKKIDLLAIEDLYREHVTLYLWDHLQDFVVKAIKAPCYLAFPNLRFDIDTKEDLVKLELLVKSGVTLNTSAEQIIQLAKSSPAFNTQFF
jgi:spore coat polysaccharide biosynthesis protein SpsF